MSGNQSQIIKVLQTDTRLYVVIYINSYLQLFKVIYKYLCKQLCMCRCEPIDISVACATLLWWSLKLDDSFPAMYILHVLCCTCNKAIRPQANWDNFILFCHTTSTPTQLTWAWLAVCTHAHTHIHTRSKLGFNGDASTSLSLLPHTEVEINIYVMQWMQLASGVGKPAVLRVFEGPHGLIQQSKLKL